MSLSDAIKKVYTAFWYAFPPFASGFLVSRMISVPCRMKNEIVIGEQSYTIESSNPFKKQ